MKALAPGFLIAMPQLGDPNFHRSVVLMLEHSGQGAMGLVVTRPAPLDLAELARTQKLSIADQRKPEPVYLGGPVEPQRGFVLHDFAQVSDAREVLPGLFLSLTTDALTELLVNPGPRIRFFLGYAGWGGGQIERELSEGSWLFSEASAELLFGQKPSDLWDVVVRGMGVDPARLQPAKGVH